MDALAVPVVIVPPRARAVAGAGLCRRRHDQVRPSDQPQGRNLLSPEGTATAAGSTSFLVFRSCGEQCPIGTKMYAENTFFVALKR
jgi:hypothetical protein